MLQQFGVRVIHSTWIKASWNLRKTVTRTLKHKRLSRWDAGTQFLITQLRKPLPAWFCAPLMLASKFFTMLTAFSLATVNFQECCLQMSRENKPNPNPPNQYSEITGRGGAKGSRSCCYWLPYSDMNVDGINDLLTRTYLLGQVYKHQVIMQKGVTTLHWCPHPQELVWYQSLRRNCRPWSSFT